MDPISNVDSLVLLLRQRLTERSRTASPATSGSRRQPRAAPDAADHLRAIAGVDGVNGRQLKRALVQSLLTEHFGAAFINDARFQLIVDQVTDTIEREPGPSKILAQVIRELQASAR